MCICLFILLCLYFFNHHEIIAHSRLVYWTEWDTELHEITRIWGKFATYRNYKKPGSTCSFKEPVCQLIGMEVHIPLIIQTVFEFHMQPIRFSEEFASRLHWLVEPYAKLRRIERIYWEIITATLSFVFFFWCSFQKTFNRIEFQLPAKYGTGLQKGFSIDFKLLVVWGASKLHTPWVQKYPSTYAIITVPHLTC